MLDTARPLRTHFVLTSMEVGGAEILLINLMRRFNPNRIQPRLICTKHLGQLGEEVAREFPTVGNLIGRKYDVRILPRIVRLLRRDRADAIVTVGAGDKMFWGRLAAKIAGVPVILSALHSTGWPDVMGRLNRSLTPWTDAFIAVAHTHQQFLQKSLRLSAQRVAMIPNGIDTDRFRPDRATRLAVRQAMKVGPETEVIGIVAALRPEKDHELFVATAAQLLVRNPQRQFWIVGDGPMRATIESAIAAVGGQQQIRLLGNRADTPQLLAAMDLFLLTSQMEAKPVSILEAQACGLPVVAPAVGSIGETVINGVTGQLVLSRSAEDFAIAVDDILSGGRRGEYGAAARRLVCDTASIDRMVIGYEDLITDMYRRKCGTPVTSELGYSTGGSDSSIAVATTASAGECRLA